MGVYTLKKSIMLILLVIILTSMFVTSCDSNFLNKEINFSQEKIVKAKLSEKEERLLRAVSNRHFIFDILKINKEYKKITIWVDAYKDGEFAGKRLSLTASIDEPNNSRILLAIQGVNSSTGEEKWILSVLDSKGHSSGSAIMEMPQGTSGLALTSVESVEIIEEETINLSAVVISTGDGSISISSSFLEDQSLMKETLLKNDYVFILRCSFSKEDL